MNTIVWVMLDAQSTLHRGETIAALFELCMHCACYLHSFASTPYAARAADDEFGAGRAHLYAPYRITLERVS